MVSISVSISITPGFPKTLTHVSHWINYLPALFWEHAFFLSTNMHLFPCTMHWASQAGKVTMIKWVTFLVQKSDIVTPNERHTQLCFQMHCTQLTFERGKAWQCINNSNLYILNVCHTSCPKRSSLIDFERGHIPFLLIWADVLVLL